MRQTLITLSALSALALGSCAKDEAPVSASCETRAYEEVGGPISLIDHTGAEVTEADYKGAPSLVFFGFTYCPDVCPFTLVTMSKAFEMLPDGVETPRTILISVDSERDTPEALKTYIETEAFPDDIVGLTGTEEQIRSAASEFLADYSRIETPESLAEYTMDHTALVYLMDENWQLKTFFDHTDSPETMSACLARHL